MMTRRPFVFVAEGRKSALRTAVDAFQRVVAVEAAELLLVGPEAREVAREARSSFVAAADETSEDVVERYSPNALIIPDSVRRASELSRRCALAGIPIISVDGPAARTILSSTRKGDAMVPPNDPRSIAKEMLALVRTQNPEHPNHPFVGPPKKLLIFRTGLGQGGADRVTITLLQSLDRSKLRPKLLLMRAEGPYAKDVPEGVEVESLERPSLWKSLPALRDAIERDQPDILFAIGGGESLLALVAHELTGRKCRLVLSERNIVWNGGRSKKRAFEVALKSLLYPRADLLTAVSDGVKEDFATRIGLDPDFISVVFNPMVDEGLDALAREPLSHPWFTSTVPVILGCGRLIPQKGFDVLLRAFASVRAKREAKLVILGEGSSRDSLIELARSLGIETDVDFVGFDKNPFKYMSRAYAFVLSSFNEGLPGALIQAMASGAPAISTRCPSGPDEIISRPGENGLLVPVGDPDAMASSLELLLSNRELRDRMATAGRAAVQRFEVKRAVLAYEHALLGAGS